MAKTQLADIKERAQPLLETMARIMVIDPVYEVQRPNKELCLCGCWHIGQNVKGQAVTQWRQGSREKSTDTHTHPLTPGI